MKKSKTSLEDKKKTPGKSKYNWPEIKVEYLSGKTKDAIVFIKQKFSLPRDKKINSTIAKAIKGWAKDWTANQKKRADALIEIINKTEVADMAEALENIRDYFKQKTLDPNGRLRVDDAEKIWKILRVENGLATTISRNIVTVPHDPDDALNKLQNEGNLKIQDTKKIRNNRKKGRAKVVPK